jgi:hypothetical protein
MGRRGCRILYNKENISYHVSVQRVRSPSSKFLDSIILENCV